MITTERRDLPGVYPVTEYGAVGDGTHNDTGALQNAIDACSAQGGGQVLVPRGTYRTGTLYLRDNIDLHLGAGSIIRGSTDRTDYNSDDAFPESQAWPAENVTGAHLIVAHSVCNISITGFGTIDGNSSAFFDPMAPYEHDDSYRAPRRMFSVKDWRPGQMVWLCRCRNVAVRDVTLRDAPYWTLLFLGCEDVHVRGLTITNPPQTPNGDGVGINMTSCYPIPPNLGALMENITFSNVRARVTAGAYVGGNADNYAEDVSFRDWDIYVHDRTQHAPE